VERDGASGDRGGAGTAIGDDHVAIDQHRALTQRLEVDGRTQGPADQPLDLLRPSADVAALTVRARVRGTRQHRILGGDPPGAGAPAPLRQRFLDRRGAQHARAPGGDEAGTLGVGRDPDLDGEGTRLGRRAAGSLVDLAHAFSERMARSRSVVERPAT
jgi:hypothetical protein